MDGVWWVGEWECETEAKEVAKAGWKGVSFRRPAAIGEDDSARWSEVPLQHPGSARLPPRVGTLQIPGKTQHRACPGLGEVTHPVATTLPRVVTSGLLLSFRPLGLGGSEHPWTLHQRFRNSAFTSLGTVGFPE